jgi:hypothetical protein
MPTFVLTEATLLQGTGWTGTAPGPSNPAVSGTVTSSTDWSDHVEQINFNMAAANIDFTNFADKGFVSNKPGLLSFDFSVMFQQDVAASSIDAIYGAAFLARTLLYFDLKAASAARGTSNPSWVIAAYVAKYPAFGGSVGSKAAATIEFMQAGKFARLTA